ncbi:hypothetical protein ABKN59_005113 [Abortiporus biennis]
MLRRFKFSTIGSMTLTAGKSSSCSNVRGSFPWTLLYIATVRIQNHHSSFPPFHYMTRHQAHPSSIERPGHSNMEDRLYPVDELLELVEQSAANFDATKSAFSEGSKILAQHPNIGAHHHLSNDWDNIRQQWRSCVQSSRGHAAICASFLRDQEIVLKSRLDIRGLENATEVFTVEINEHLGHANTLNAKYEHLRQAVELFPSHVIHYLDVELPSQKTRWQKMREKIDGFCVTVIKGIMSLWGCVKPLVKKFSCAHGNTAFSFEASYHPLGDEQDIPLRERMNGLRRECETLEENLSLEVTLWNAIRTNFLQLRGKVIHGALIQEIRASFLPDDVTKELIRALEAYAIGRAPA